LCGCVWGRAKVSQFQEVQVHVVATDAEKVGLDALVSRGPAGELLSEAELLTAALHQLLETIDGARRYVDDVVVSWLCILGVGMGWGPRGKAPFVGAAGPHGACAVRCTLGQCRRRSTACPFLSLNSWLAGGVWCALVSLCMQSGRTEGNVEVGRRIADALSSVPLPSEALLGSGFKAAVYEIAMVWCRWCLLRRLPC
jgi:hypothetical protein